MQRKVQVRVSRPGFQRWHTKKIVQKHNLTFVFNNMNVVGLLQQSLKVESLIKIPSLVRFPMLMNATTCYAPK